MNHILFRTVASALCLLSAEAAAQMVKINCPPEAVARSSQPLSAAATKEKASRMMFQKTNFRQAMPLEAIEFLERRAAVDVGTT